MVFIKKNMMLESKKILNDALNKKNKNIKLIDACHHYLMMEDLYSVKT